MGQVIVVNGAVSVHSGDLTFPAMQCLNSHESSNCGDNSGMLIGLLWEKYKRAVVDPSVIDGECVEVAGTPNVPILIEWVSVTEPGICIDGLETQPDQPTLNAEFTGFGSVHSYLHKWTSIIMGESEMRARYARYNDAIDGTCVEINERGITHHG